MNKLLEFEAAQSEINVLDFRGELSDGQSMFRQYQRRNCFGVDRNKRIYRIFQQEYLESDISGGFLTLPKASASVWNDPLENPLANVKDVDVVTGCDIYLGALVCSFHALCWTRRAEATPEDWASFSHGSDAVRIETTVGKLMDRVMDVRDPAYMNRVWLIEVEYQDSAIIEAMQNPAEIYRRMKCGQGALLALSSAVVRTEHSGEDEIRLLIDSSPPLPTCSQIAAGDDLLRIKFDWEGFIDNKQLKSR